MGLKTAISEALPANFQNDQEMTYALVTRFMNEEFGEKKWSTEKRPSKSKPGSYTSYLIIL